MSSPFLPFSTLSCAVLYLCYPILGPFQPLLFSPIFHILSCSVRTLCVGAACVLLDRMVYTAFLSSLSNTQTTTRSAPLIPVFSLLHSTCLFFPLFFPSLLFLSSLILFSFLLFSFLLFLQRYLPEVLECDAR
jgi:hypothetical protein